MRAFVSPLQSHRKIQGICFIWWKKEREKRWSFLEIRGETNAVNTVFLEEKK